MFRNCAKTLVFSFCRGNPDFDRLAERITNILSVVKFHWRAINVKQRLKQKVEI